MIDFKEITQRIDLVEAAQKLGLQMKVEGKALRTRCPHCSTSDDRSLTITPQKGYYCQSAKRGGVDSIGLVAHCHGTDREKGGMKAAAEWLQERTGTMPVTLPQKATGNDKATPPADTGQQPTAPLQRIAERLQHDHPAVLALGLAAETAAELGIGFDARGVLKGRVLIPLYRDGALAGFCGFAEDQQPVLKFPTQIAPEQQTIPENVVKFPKRA